MGFGSTNVMGARPTGYQCSAVTAYTAAVSIRAAAGSCLFVAGYNSGPDQFIQVHDKATAPANADVPKLVLAVPAGTNFFFVIPIGGFEVVNGIGVCNSSTGPTATLGSADCWFTWAHCN